VPTGHLVTPCKIDQSFIADMTTNPVSAAIVRSTTRLIQDLGKAVVAEGVEDQPTLDILTDIGCDTAQGYHYSRPLDIPSFITWANTYTTRTAPGIAEPNEPSRIPNQIAR